MAKFPNWLVGTDVSATNLANCVPNIVTKASTNSITSNTTLANDPELQNIALESGTWEIEVKLYATGQATAADLKTAWAFTGTTTGTPVRDMLGPAGSNTAAATAVTPINMSCANYTTAFTYGLRTTTPFYVIREECTNFVVASAGNLSIQVAQGTSNASATVVQAGSRVRCRRIA